MKIIVTPLEYINCRKVSCSTQKCRRCVESISLHVYPKVCMCEKLKNFQSYAAYEQHLMAVYCMRKKRES